VLNSCIEVSDYNEPYSLCQPLLPSPVSTLGLTRAKPFGIPTPLHLVKSNPTRESNAKTPPLYPFQLSPNALKPESHAILRLILVRKLGSLLSKTTALLKKLRSTRICKQLSECTW
jgi:hypothetical protein